MVIGLLLIAVASMSWGTTGATMTVLARKTGVGPLFVGWARLAVAAPCLVLAAAAADRLAARRRSGAEPRTSVGIAWATRDVPSYVFLGLAMAAYQACYFWAVTLTGVAVAALLAICSAPLMISVLAALFLKERPTPIVWLALGMAVIGTALLVAGPPGSARIPGHFGVGALLAVGAGASYAAYAITAKRVLSRMRPLPVAAITFTAAAAFLAPVLLGERVPPGTLAIAWPWLLYLGVGPTAAAYVLFTVGLRRVPATAAGIVSLLEPLTATMLGVVAFGESLGALGIMGGLLLLASLALLVAPARSPGAGG
jgi:drug/metabolite transporter, DME family